ncbi:MAG: 4-hydroxy-tetrahydrodipicolinate synthase [Pseudomonadota bacterium]
MFNGSIVALITPFDERGIDRLALTRLIRYHLDNATSGIVPVGTTGEASVLSAEEPYRVIEKVVHEVGGQVPVLAGAGTNAPEAAIAFSNNAARAGADGVLHVAGYYNRPHQEGLYQHFRYVCERVDLPVVVYNVPPRAVVDILPETLARIAELPNVVGVKDATCDLTRPVRERNLIEKQFCFLSGEDSTAVAYNAHGGVGCISVTANIAPALCAQIQRHCKENDFSAALEIQRRLMSLHRALFLEPSPAGVKYAASLLGLTSDACRLPMVPLTEDTRRSIESAMRSADVLSV